MSDELYRDYILEHYKSPHHFGTLEQYDLQAHDVNPLCGDELQVQIAVDENGVITDIAFEGAGCAISQASASIASDEYIGMNVDQVTGLDHAWIQDLLGIEISPTRKKCAQLNLKVMRGAVTGEATWPEG
ncbi:MAG: SUF system NifU family Fe-S cluster assembly protein [Thermoleophilaceae bacterium]|nr:SUF system NifU family Fe-S cluster assembly protein [Thermoleophilaceae bacterium]